MKWDSIRGLDLMVSIESTLAEIYGMISNLPGYDTELWRYLSGVEQSHAAVAAIVAAYYRRGEFGDEDILDISGEELERAEGSALSLRARLAEGDIAVSDALRKVLDLEENTCRRFLSGLAEKRQDSGALRKLAPLIYDIHEHVRALKEHLGNSMS